MTTTADHERQIVLELVALSIWHTPGGLGKGVCWTDAQHRPELSAAVEWTRAAARNAIESLLMSEAPNAGFRRMALAGEHVSGLEPLICVEVFDAMLTEALS